MNETIVLIYKGDGTAVIPGVALRDLTKEEIEKSGLSVADLVASGLYKKPTKKRTVKDGRN